MDLMVPPLAVSSQLDLSSTASTDANDLSLIYQINNNENLLNIQNSKQLELNASSLNAIMNANSNSTTLINGSNNNTNFNACYQTMAGSNNKKQINKDNLLRIAAFSNSLID
jgi:transcriptional regulator with PAS, ATPase and Fis domain